MQEITACSLPDYDLGKIIRALIQISEEDGVDRIPITELNWILSHYADIAVPDEPAGTPLAEGTLLQEEASLGNIKIVFSDRLDCAWLTITDLDSGSVIVLDSNDLNKLPAGDGLKAEMILRQFSRKLAPV